MTTDAKAGAHSIPLAPSKVGTAVLLASLLIATFATGGDRPSEPAARAAWITLPGLLGLLTLEIRRAGWQRWLRADIVLLAAGWFFTLFEFLFPQPRYDAAVTTSASVEATRLVLLGLAALAVGRHLVPPLTERPRPAATGPPLDLREAFWALVACFVLGFLYMFATVGFNPVTLVRELFQPRFSQPWARDRLGDWRALFSELQLLRYLIPPLAAHLLVRRRELPIWQTAVTALLLGFLFLASFASGTRSVFFAHVATFAGGLVWSLPRVKRWHALTAAVTGTLLLVLVTGFALQFRRTGLAGLGQTTGAKPLDSGFRLMVDYNLRTIALLTAEFPEQSAHLGWEIPMHVAVRPIPRTLWPGKPEKLSVSMEEVVGIPETSISSSFAGEGFMMAGAWGVLIFGTGLGALAALWNRIRPSPDSAFHVVAFASGFYWVVLAARSPIWLTVGLLPPLAWWIGAGAVLPLVRRCLSARSHT